MTKIKRVPGGTINDKGRWVPDVPKGEAFYCFAMGGNAVRNGHRIRRRGWYIITDDDKLLGPFQHERQAVVPGTKPCSPGSA